MTDETLLKLTFRTPESERRALLQRICDENPDLRERITGLLKEDAEAQQFRFNQQEHQAAGELTKNYKPVEPTEGMVIADRYTLKQKLGEGGMGEVWVARQSEPVKRNVAIKLIKMGMDSKAVMARFEQERQALAVMDHPHIARVLDGGLTVHGAPFFVMELVTGSPLIKFCDSHKLPVHARLELFILICQAVQHAHQKGIVHRDLKPGNILVTLIDGKPTPKVIDFGVAKAMSGKLTEMSLSTQFGAIIGTMEYMAPEQTGMSMSDVDTRADIYSLGVILFELLTGLRPFDSQRLKEAAFDEMIRILREEEPPSLASRLSTNDSLASVAATRQLEPNRLLYLIRGELDWIVHKCLEKDRNRRYETSNGLARDVQRYLCNEPVEAKPISVHYRLKKFMYRHRGQVIAAGLILTALITGLIVSLWQMNRAIVAEKKAIEERDDKDAERQRAEELEKLAQKERDRAESEKAVAVAVRDFLQHNLIRQASVYEQANRSQLIDREMKKVRHDVTVRELLDSAAREFSLPKIQDKFPNQPVVQAEILETISEAYQGIGDYTKAVEFCKVAYELRERQSGSLHPSTLVNLVNLAFVNLSNLQHTEAVNSLLTVISRLQTVLDAPPVPGTPDVAAATMDAVLQCVEKHLHPVNMRQPVLHVGVAEGAMILIKVGQAIPRLKKMSETAEQRFGKENKRSWIFKMGIGFCHHAMGQLKEAMAIYEQVLSSAESQLPDDSVFLISLREILAHTYGGLRINYDKQVQLLEQLVSSLQKLIGKSHPTTLGMQYNLACVHSMNSKWDLAVPLFEYTLKNQKEILGFQHPETKLTIISLRTAYQEKGELGKVVQLQEQTVEMEKKEFGIDHPQTLESMKMLGAWYHITDNDKAIPHYEEYTALLRKKLSGNPVDLSYVLFEVGCEFLGAKQFVPAEKYLNESYRIYQPIKPNTWELAAIQYKLGVALLGLKKYSDAESFLLKGYHGLKDKHDPASTTQSSFLSDALDHLIKLYTETKKPDEAAKWQAVKDKK